MADHTHSHEESNDSDSDIDVENLTPGELSLHEEKRRKRAEHAGQLARDQRVESCAVTVVLFDKGTRLGSELWEASGCIVRHPACDRPCLLSTGDTVPDAYHAAHAILFMSVTEDSREPCTIKLDAGHFFISTWKDPLVEAFPVEDVQSALQANYCLVSLGDSPLPEHIEPLDLIANSVGRVEPRFELTALQSPRAPEIESLVRIKGVVNRVNSGVIILASDPLTDTVVRAGCPVFSRARDEDAGTSNLALAGIHLGHRVDLAHRKNAEEEEKKSSGVEFYSHGSWQHSVLGMATVLRHYHNATHILSRRAVVAQRELEAFVGKGNARRDRIQECTEILHEILAHPDKPPPEIFEAEDAEALSVIALRRGFEPVITLLRIYRDAAIQRYSLEALAKALTAGTRGCSPSTVAAAGGCELVSLALQKYSTDPDLVAAACWCVTLLAEASDVSRRFLRCDGSSAMVAALRRNCEHGASHSGAQQWGLSAVSVLARNGMHRERMVADGVCEILPSLISNDPEVLEKVDLQVWGLHAIMELCSGPSAETAGEALLEAGVMDSLRKVRKLRAGTTQVWKDLASFVLEELDWEE